MVRIGVISKDTPSLSVVSKDLVYALQKLGHASKFYNYMVAWHEAQKMMDRSIITMTFDPLYCLAWFLTSRDHSLRNVYSVIYTTVEGTPKPWLVPPWIRRDCIVVANSYFTEKMLKRVDIDVAGTIHHGVNLEHVEKAKQDCDKVKELLHYRLNAKTVIGTVASSHPRKGLNLLADVIRHVRQQTKDVAFYILSNPGAKITLTGLEGVYVDTRFGKMDRIDVLKTMSGFDFYLQPSLCEGFGLPVLESMALGVPVIIPDYEPLNEIATDQTGYKVPTTGEDEADFGDGILYECHYYDPAQMAKTVLAAHETHVGDEKAYRKTSKAALQRAKEFDCVKKYSEFLKLWEL